MASYTPAAVRALGQRYTALGSYFTAQKPKVVRPPRANVSVPRFKPPRPVDDNGMGSVDFTPEYSVGTEQPQAPSFQEPSNALALALAARSRSEAKARAAAKKKQAAVEYGEGPEGEANPFSVLKVAERNYNQGVGDLEERLNQANLFYSGYRGKALGDAATQYQQTRYDAGTRYRGLLSDIDDALAQALLNADMLEMQAGGGGGAGGGSGGDNGAGLVGRPGEWNPGIPIVEGWNPIRNSDAKYDTNWILANGGRREGNDIVDAWGNRYDGDGRRK